MRCFRPRAPWMYHACSACRHDVTIDGDVHPIQGCRVNGCTSTRCECSRRYVSVILRRCVYAITTRIRVNYLTNLYLIALASAGSYDQSVFQVLSLFGVENSNCEKSRFHLFVPCRLCQARIRVIAILCTLSISEWETHTGYLDDVLIQEYTSLERSWLMLVCVGRARLPVKSPNPTDGRVPLP